MRKGKLNRGKATDYCIDVDEIGPHSLVQANVRTSSRGRNNFSSRGKIRGTKRLFDFLEYADSEPNDGIAMDEFSLQIFMQNGH